MFKSHWISLEPQIYLENNLRCQDTELDELEKGIKALSPRYVGVRYFKLTNVLKTQMRTRASSFFFYNFVEIEFMCHKIHPFNIYNSGVFSMFTELHSLYCNLSGERFHHPKWNPTTICVVIPHPSLTPNPLSTTNLLSTSIDLPLLEISYKWNHTICSFLYWLLSLRIMLSSWFIHI